MSISYKKGNTTAIVIVVIIIVLAAAAYFMWQKSGSTALDTTGTQTTDQTGGTATSGQNEPLNTTDASISADVTTVDNDMDALSKDSAAVESSFSDKPVSQEY